jgi:hypothetical protein
MDAADELLGTVTDKGNNEPGTPDKGTPASSEKVYEINGKKYSQTQFDELAKDYEANFREQGRLAAEVDNLKKSTPKKTVEASADEGLPESERPRVKKVFKEELGFVTNEDLDVRDYVKDATKEVQRIAKEYEFANPDDLFKEMIDLNRRVPVEKLELFFKLNHPDLYEKKRAAGIAADKQATPYTERTAKPGAEMPKAPIVTWKKGNTVSAAMELIGAKE